MKARCTAHRPLPLMNHDGKPLPEHFDYCPSCGNPALGKPKRSPFTCPQCGMVIHFSPVTSAAALINDSSGNLLFIERKRDPQKGKLGVPGGFLDPGEDLESALRREVKEEVGLELIQWSYLGGWPNSYSYKSVVYAVTDIYFTAQAQDFSLVETCQREVDGIVIANPQSIDPERLAFPSLRQAVRTYLSHHYTD